MSDARALPAASTLGPCGGPVPGIPAFPGADCGCGWGDLCNTDGADVQRPARLAPDLVAPG